MSRETIEITQPVPVWYRSAQDPGDPGVSVLPYLVLVLFFLSICSVHFGTWLPALQGPESKEKIRFEHLEGWQANIISDTLKLQYGTDPIWSLNISRVSLNGSRVSFHGSRASLHGSDLRSDGLIIIMDRIRHFNYPLYANADGCQN
jgi:hypothetical protein